MRRVLTALAFATIAGALVFGAAAALDVGSNNLGSGSDTVASCDATVTGGGDGINVEYVLDATDPTQVSGVDLSLIDAACDTQDIYVVVADGSGVPLGSGSLLSYAHSDGTAMVSLDSNAPAESVESVAVTITGTPPPPP